MQVSIEYLYGGLIWTTALIAVFNVYNMQKAES